MTDRGHTGWRLRFTVALLVGAVAVAGCTSAAKRKARLAEIEAIEAPDMAGAKSGDILQRRTVRKKAPRERRRVSNTTGREEPIAYRRLPKLNDENLKDSGGSDAGPLFSDRRLDVSVSPQRVPAFINTVFGELLGVGFSLGKGVSERSEIVSFRTARNISEADLYETARNTLKDFGIAVVYEDGVVKAFEQDHLKRDAPIFIRARSRESVPSGLRPVFMFVDLLAIKASEMSSILVSAFPDKKKLSVKTNSSSNSLTLSGLPGDVERALEIVNQMDELRFAGTRMVTYRVRNWETKELAKTLQEVLTMEGFSIGSTSAAAKAITMFPIEYTREILILAHRDDMLEYAVNSARRLDLAAAPGEERQARVYRAEYYDAKELVSVLKQVYEFKNQGKKKTKKKTAKEKQEKGSADGSFVVDPQGNRIIFFATQEEYLEILKLVRQIDRPAKEVLIEVTIAEIRLTDEVQFGLEGLLTDAVGDNAPSNLAFGGTSGGLRGLYLSGNFRAEFRALSKNGLVNILSTPRVVTKSGAVANVQVGTDVPIITSQAAASSQTGGSTNVLQSVEYRKTGIILKLEPLVFSDNRIDLTISQEVSSAEVNQNSSISSPTISNRSIETQLSLQDGQSAVMGGLIENRYTRNDTGVPFLKDLPLLGRLFSSQSLTASRTVLMVMVTPYILSTRGDRDEVVQSFSDIINDAFEKQLRGSSTLTAPRSPFKVGNR